MNLLDLDPRWISDGKRSGMGVSFLCPHCHNVTEPYEPRRLFVIFENPIDGGAPMDYPLRWGRTGVTLKTLTLTPSIDASGDGHWHGFIRNGVIT